MNKIIDKWNIVLKSIRGESAKSAGNKFKSSIFSIVLGLLIGVFLILAKGGSPWATYKSMFVSNIFGSTYEITSYIYYAVMFIILGVGIGISFKTGLFNIGASGQFLLAGISTVWLGSKLDFVGGSYFMIIIAIISGAFLASIAGFLKAFFNVHEVVSTILLNWILTYFAKYLINTENKRLGGTNGSSVYMNESMYFSSAEGSYAFIVAIILMLIVVVGTYLLFKYTSFGYKLRMNGESTSVAEYAGINKKMTTIISMSLSGALAGLAGFIFYGSLNQQIPAISSPPIQGFEAITVTLLASSSPLGAIPAGLFYAAISNSQTLSDAIAGGGNVLGLVLGIVIFISSISSSFDAIHPISFTIKTYITMRLNSIKVRRSIFLSKKRVILESEKESLIVLKNDWKSNKKLVYKKLRNVHRNKIKQLQVQLNSEYDEKLELEFKHEKESFENSLRENKIFEYKQNKMRIKLNLKEEKKWYKSDVNSIYKKHIAITNLMRKEYKQNKSNLINSNIDKMSLKTKVSDLRNKYKFEIKELYKAEKISENGGKNE